MADHLTLKPRLLHFHFKLYLKILFSIGYILLGIVPSGWSVFVGYSLAVGSFLFKLIFSIPQSTCRSGVFRNAGEEFHRRSEERLVHFPSLHQFLSYSSRKNFYLIKWYVPILSVRRREVDLVTEPS